MGKWDLKLTQTNKIKCRNNKISSVKVGFINSSVLSCPKLISGQSVYFMTEVGSLYLKVKIKMESITH